VENRYGKKWVKKLNNKAMSTKYRALRSQIFELLRIRSFSDIPPLLQNNRDIDTMSLRAYQLFGRMFGIEGTQNEIISKITEYTRIADSTINYLKKGIFSCYSTDLEITNEIESISNPVHLLLIIFNDRYHKKARFEAKRKLILMTLAGSIEQRERETKIEEKFAQFLDFLNDYVWSSSIKIGELKKAYILSTHDQESFTCTSVKILDKDALKIVKLMPGQKLTTIKRRKFERKGKIYPIYVTIRKKSPETKVLKLLRKGQDNPAAAVDDELGLMGVLNSLADVKAFQKHLSESAARCGSLLSFEEISDTLSGGIYSGNSPGSSPSTRMLKFFTKMGGMRVEFIIHTNETYLNYLYQRDISHDEYEVRRIFNSGVAELLFPEDIYNLPMVKIKEELLRRVRKRIEEL
jgi:hypothetical protein